MAEAEPPLEVLVLDHSAARSGAELALLRLLTHLPEGYATTTLLFAPGPLADALAEAGLAVSVLPLDEAAAGVSRLDPLAMVRAGGRFAGFTVRLVREVRTRRPDVLHANSLKAGVLGLVAARLTGTPMVWYVHDRIAPDYLPRPLAGLLRRLIGLADVVVVNSRATAGTLPGVRTLVAYPGFTPDQVGDSRAAPSGGAAPGPETVGLIGRISPTKGQWEFVRAAASVLRDREGVRFRVLGTPLFGEEDYASRVRAEAVRLGVADRIDFAGFVPDPRAALDGLSVCVHASPVPEPFGQVLVEAMIRGVPVIATDAGGAPEVLDGGTRALGLLVPPGDSDALAAAILQVLEHPDEAAARAGAARESALARFPIVRTAAVVTRAWQAAARGRARPPSL